MMTRKIGRRNAVVVGLSLVLTAGILSVRVRAITAQPVLVDLGTLGGSSSTAVAVNDTGMVVGISFMPGNAAFHAFVWTQADGMIDLGTLGGTSSRATAVNNNGMVVGASYLLGDAIEHAFAWTPGAGMVDLGTLPGFSYSYATAVNDSGVVVGQISPPGQLSHTFVWTQTDGMIDIDALSGTDWSQAFGGISDTGMVVGISSRPGNAGPHAFAWTRIGGMVDLGTTRTSSAAFAVNDHGLVVGENFNPGAFSIEAFGWTQTAGMFSLGTLGGTRTRAFAVNNNGMIVGGASTSGDFEFHPFVWTSVGGMLDIGTLGRSSAPGAFAVNDNGMVIGQFITLGGTTHAFAWRESAGMIDLGTLGGTFAVPYALNKNGMVVGVSSTPGDVEQHATVWVTAPSTGIISVATNLSAASFNITGPSNYSGSGTSFIVNNAPAGDYTITYGALNCYATPPPQTLTLAAGGTLNFNQANYGGAATISVNVSPLGAAAATFSISPPVSGIGSSGPYPVIKTSVSPAAYTVTFNPISGFVTPPAQTVAPNSFCRIETSGVYSPTPVVKPGQVILTVGKNGSGSGSVKSSPIGIDCGSTCGAALGAGSHVKLEAVAAPGSVFVGWSNSFCKGTLRPCAFTIPSNTSIMATFVSAPTDSSNKIIYVGVCGAGCISPGFGLYFPQNLYSWVDPLNDTELDALGLGQNPLDGSGLAAIALRIGRLFPTSFTVVAGFSLAEVALGTFTNDGVDSVVNMVVSVYNPGDRIYLVGHSAGGAIVSEVVKRLLTRKIPVAMTGEIDSVSKDPKVPKNVARVFNFYYPWDLSCPVFGVPEFVPAKNNDVTIISNTRIDAPLGPDDLGRPCGGHMNMDNDPKVWRPILDFMVGIP